MQKRLSSLDAFRGITIAGMILVNNPGSWSHVYPPLLHSEWNGWTPTDLIFPFFLFIVGVALTFSLEKQLNVHDRRYVYLKIARRTLILFGLGLFLSGFPYYNLAKIRIPGVLQRIAVVYCIASVITLNTRVKGQAWTMAGLLLLYWGLMKLIPVPGHGAGDLSATGNLAAFVDNKLLHGHIWKETWDPEGVLSTIPAVATTLSGVLTGHWLRSGRDKQEIAGWMFVAGWIAIVVVLAGAHGNFVPQTYLHQDLGNAIVRVFFTLLLVTNLFLAGCKKGENPTSPPEKKTPRLSRVAGFRASRILQSYPNREFPPKEYWQKVAEQMSGKFTETQPGGIWIVGLYQSDGSVRLNFPVYGTPFDHIRSILDEQNEAYLSYFDQKGINVWLQVEPGLADVDTLISIVLNRYKNHSSVVGFGVDVEWYQTSLHAGGKKVSDAEAECWEQKVKAVNPDYTLFLKHYSKSRMPPAYRGDLIFVDDSQDFSYSADPFHEMINEYSDWGTEFFPNKVAFQYGYPNDRFWWSKLSDPPGDIGNALLQNISNCFGLFWVDFTVTEVFPLD